MTLSDNIARLRRQNGWSQEELADRMGVSRQAVSKWESGQAVPDLDKIPALADLFGVTADVLLRGEVPGEKPESAVPSPDDRPQTTSDCSARRLTREVAEDYLARRETDSVRIAVSTFLCIFAVIPLLILGALSEVPAYGISGNTAVGIGLVVLFVIVAIAVSGYLYAGFRNTPYQWLDQDPFEADADARRAVEEREARSRSAHARLSAAGAVLCVLSPIPLFAGLIADGDNDLLLVVLLCSMLFLAGIGVTFLIISGVRQASIHRILKTGDFAPENRAANRLSGTISTVFWLVATAVYLASSFATDDWGHTWIVWPVAGVLYAAVMNLCNLFRRT